MSNIHIKEKSSISSVLSVSSQIEHSHVMQERITVQEQLPQLSSQQPVHPTQYREHQTKNTQKLPDIPLVSISIGPVFHSLLCRTATQS